MSTPVVSNDPAGDALLLALTDAIRSASSPEMQQAQALLLRRLATEGDVIPSRIPAPKNITEIGGYFNLLTDLAQEQMRLAMLGSALGLASQPFGDATTTTPPPLRPSAVANDRPAGPGGAAVPLTVSVRSDLAAGLQAAISRVHAAGGILPLLAPPPVLAPPATLDPDPLVALGRAVWLAPTAALADPATDPYVLGRAATDPAPGFRVGVRVGPAVADAPELDWTGLVFDAVGQAFVERALGPVGLLPIEAALAGTPFTATPVAAAPSRQGDVRWARLVALTGLVPGVTRFGDELALVWDDRAVAGSAFAARVDQLWTGTTFA